MPRLLQGMKRDGEIRSQRLLLASRRSKSPSIALPIVGSPGGSLGEGIAGPPAHIIAFQASNSSRSASWIFASAALRDQDRFPIGAFVDPLRLRLAVAA
jgi:hypothetical protein